MHILLQLTLSFCVQGARNETSGVNLDNAKEQADKLYAAGDSEKFALIP